jgi:vancomycin resistance protein YoaR
VLAGFPILQRKPHSLWVNYYEKYGAGVDATVFPGVQDLVFLNDTKDVIVFQAAIHGTDVHVSVYGTPDGRKVEMKGPFFSGAIPTDMRKKGLSLAPEEIGWEQRITYADGRVSDKFIISYYFKGIPRRSLISKYSNGVGEAELFAGEPVL